jgi:phosphinothricin acetyltransferase
MIIRPVSQSDVTGILDIYNPFILTSPVTYEEVPLTQDQMRERIQKYTQQFPWLVAMGENNEVLGYAYASQHRERAAYRWCTDVSVYVKEGNRGKKIGESLYKELFRILRKQNYHVAYAIISLPNDASIKLHEKLGFTYVGTFHKAGYKLGKWHDVGWWELKLNSSEHPLEPKAYLLVAHEK